MKPFTHLEYETYIKYKHSYGSLFYQYETHLFNVNSGDPETVSDLRDLFYTEVDYNRFILMKAFIDAVAS